MPASGPENKKTQVDELPADSTDGDSESAPESKRAQGTPAREIGGPKGPDPVRYGDWERGGRCIDF